MSRGERGRRERGRRGEPAEAASAGAGGHNQSRHRPDLGPLRLPVPCRPLPPAAAVARPGGGGTKRQRQSDGGGRRRGWRRAEPAGGGVGGERRRAEEGLEAADPAGGGAGGGGSSRRRTPPHLHRHPQIRPPVRLLSERRSEGEISAAAREGRGAGATPEARGGGSRRIPLDLEEDESRSSRLTEVIEDRAASVLLLKKGGESVPEPTADSLRSAPAASALPPPTPTADAPAPAAARRRRPPAPLRRLSLLLAPPSAASHLLVRRYTQPTPRLSEQSYFPTLRGSKMLGVARRRLGSGCVLGQLMQALHPAAAAAPAAARAYSAAKEVDIVVMGEKKHDDPSVVTASHHDILASVFESKEEAQNSIVYTYKNVFSGFAARLTESQAKTISSLPEVIGVEPNTHYKLLTTRSSVMPNTHYKTLTTLSWDFLGLNYYQSS